MHELLQSLLPKLLIQSLISFRFVLLYLTLEHQQVTTIDAEIF